MNEQNSSQVPLIAAAQRRPESRQDRCPPQLRPDRCSTRHPWRCRMGGRAGTDGMRSRPVTALAIVSIMLAGCVQHPPLPPTTPPRTTAHVQSPGWFHQQVVAARAARRAYQPSSDTAGAQRAYDDVMTAACTRAASAGPGKYPERCDAILHPPLDQSTDDPCVGRGDDPALQTECND